MKSLVKLDDKWLKGISGGPATVVEHGPVNLFYNDQDSAPDLITFDNRRIEIKPGGGGLVRTP